MAQIVSDLAALHSIERGKIHRGHLRCRDKSPEQVSHHLTMAEEALMAVILIHALMVPDPFSGSFALW